MEVPDMRAFRCRPILIALVLALSTLTFAAPEASAAGPHIKLAPPFGPPTTKVEVSGTGFGPSETVDVTFDNYDVGYVPSDGAGAFTATFFVSRYAAPGVHHVRATGETSGLSASKPFLVRTNWDKFRFDNRNSGFNPYEHVLKPSNVPRLVTKWTAHTGGFVESSPAVVDGVVYVGADDGNVYDLKAATGGKLWSFPTGFAIFSSPAVANGVVYVSGDGGSLYALDAASGGLLWQTDIGYARSSPTVANGVVYVGGNSDVYALNASTGAVIWRVNTGDTVFSSPAVVASVVYVGFYDGVYAIDAPTGKVLWISWGGGGGLSSPAVENGIVYVGCDCGYVYALHASTGVIKWARRRGTLVYSSPAVSHGVVYIGTRARGM